jgi:CubicO group peptidase (beta-lactamase class C family)
MNNWRKSRPKTAHELGIMAGFPPPPEKQPTADNWDQPPFNRWSFQNMRSLFPTVDVYRGTGPVSDFSTNPIDILGTRFNTSTGRERTVQQFLDETYTDGLLVYQAGQIRFESYLNGMQPETLHLSQSVAKSVVGTTTGILLARGLLDLTTPLAEFVPELAACGYADATLENVLNMQSGVRFNEDYGAPDSDIARIDVAAGWRASVPGKPYQSIRDVILTLPKTRPHGTVFEYRSVETDVVAWVLERVTGTPLAELVSQEIWQPMGAERDAFFTIDRAGTALADGGFNATLRDYARFGRLFLDHTEGPVPKSWVAGCQHGETQKFGAPYTNVTPNGAYKNSWWVRDNSRGDITARGVFGQLIYVDRASDLMVVKLSSWPDYLINEFTLDTFLAIDAIRKVLETA